MKQRLTTGIIAGVLFLGFCMLGGPWYHGLVLLMALIGYYEFVKMTGVQPFSGVALIGYAGIFAIVFPWEMIWEARPLTLFQIGWLVMLVLMTASVVTKNKIPVNTVAMLFLGVMYIGIGFYYIAESRHLHHGLFWTFLLLGSIWASDAGAYFVGKLIGKNKLWPSISPNKTVEGALGGIVIAVITSVVFALVSDGLLSWQRAVWIGIACAIVGQMGDLIQSAYKRVYNIKDSGTLLPGHGGILDRCDSWIVVFPFVHILMLLPY
ncbi:phosphatidate cytidylyltransferase [Paenibacillus sp. LK1]|uniref:phosphatidate cytidylyltransferase n=1 Tax=Paenibacillus sp. LK1 TaxID=2053014 RepID=UPI000C1828A3|nr:phosphatidate cytidylyltransferase [Paenibacillus sp. LK1]PIH61226.1 phosphatidate cytidylyltransferase [Paenibacillus sp. LK1]